MTTTKRKEESMLTSILLWPRVAALSSRLGRHARGLYDARLDVEDGEVRVLHLEVFKYSRGGELADGIGREAGRGWDLCDPRADVDDGSGLGDVLQHRLRRVEGSLDVDFEGCPPVHGVGGRDGSKVGQRGRVVDVDVDWASLSDGREGFGDARGARDVGDQDGDVRAGVFLFDGHFCGFEGRLRPS